MRTRLRLLWLSPAFRVAAVVVVLAVAAVVALWPRGGESPQAVGQSRPRGHSAHIDLSAARAKAHLPACPSAHGNGTVGPLRGVRLRCLADGSQVDLGSALAGHTTVVNIWATYCPPCKEELPVLDSYSHTPGAADVLEVQYSTSPAAGLSLLSSLGVTLPGVYDSSGKTLRALGTPPNLPASYVVTPGGAVHFVSRPRVFHSVEAVAAAVRRYGGDA